MDGQMNETALHTAIARQDILQALARYARGIDRGDVELAKSAYHPDATDNHGGPFNGNAHEVMEKIAMALASAEYFRHQVTNSVIEVEGDRAFVESHHFSLTIPKDSDVEEHVYGRYLDVFECRDGEWKVLRREVTVDHSNCPPRSEPYHAQDKFFNGTRDKQDRSYALFAGE